MLFYSEELTNIEANDKRSVWMINECIYLDVLCLHDQNHATKFSNSTTHDGLISVFSTEHRKKWSFECVT